MRSARSSRTGSVLVVDDDPGIRAFATKILGDAGYTVFQADGPEQCMSQLGVVVPSIILLDVNLGNATGYELCAQIKQTYPDLRSVILFVTANRTVEDVMMSKKVGGDYFMVKPYTAEDLITNIRKATQARLRKR